MWKVLLNSKYQIWRIKEEYGLISSNSTKVKDNKFINNILIKTIE